MYLKKVGKEFPKDYKVIKHERQKGKYQIEKNGTLYDFKDHKGKKVPMLEHHPVSRLLEDLQCYNISNRDEGVEFLAVLNSALVMDDYNLLPDLITKANQSLKILNESANIEGFIERLEQAEEMLEKILKERDVEEIQEHKSRSSNLAIRKDKPKNKE